MQQHEGVIQFDLRWRQADTIEADLTALNTWRDILCRLELIGEDPQRYEGYGFGNVSQRHGTGNHFIISGTQTGHIKNIEQCHYALVTGFEPNSNRVTAEGPVRPSSESMTHGVIYSLEQSVNCVLHVHSPAIWKAAAKLGLPLTRADVDYGTPEMAAEVGRLFTETDVRQQGIFAMAGHQDGIVSFASTAEAAGMRLVKTLAHSLTRC